MKTIFAIDPGAAGGIAIQYKDYKAVCFPMPETEGDLIRLLSSFSHEPGERVFYLENLVKHMGPGMPASYMAVYASNWGFIKGAIQMQGCPLHIVTPQKWQKFLGLGITGRLKFDADKFHGLSEATKQEKARIRKANDALKRAWKKKLKGEAQRLYPHLNVTDKTADALLLLSYAKAQPI